MAPTQHPLPSPAPSPAHPLSAYLFLALSMALVGSYVALSKPLSVALPVLLLAWLRFGIGAVAMVRWLKKPPQEPPVTPATRRLLFVESLLGNVLFSICMLYGVSMTSAVSAGIILASIPAVVALLSWWWLGERISPRVAMAIACAALGLSLLSLSKQELTIQSGQGLEADFLQNSRFWGNLLVFGAVLCEAAYAVIGKKLTGVLSPKRITALINLWGLALSTPVGIYLALRFDFGAVSWSTWALVLFYGLAASVGTVWLWMTGLQTVPAAKAGVFTVMLPISAALVGVLVLGETLGGLQLLALAIALLGVLLATLPTRTGAITAKTAEKSNSLQ